MLKVLNRLAISASRRFAFFSEAASSLMAGAKMGAVNAAGRPFRVLLLDKPVRQREDLRRFEMRACGGELNVVFEAAKGTGDGPCGSEGPGEGKESAFHCVGAFGL